MGCGSTRIEQLEPKVGFCHHSNPDIIIVSCIDGGSGSLGRHVDARRGRRGKPRDHHSLPISFPL